MDAFDADVIIYAGIQDDPLGVRIRYLLAGEQTVGAAGERTVGIGSVLLVPEVLTKPLRLAAAAEFADLSWLLSQLDLRAATRGIVHLAVELAARYGLRTADAVHLATAVDAGADRFITNNRRDFGKGIVEVDITYPNELPPA